MIQEFRHKTANIFLSAHIKVIYVYVDTNKLPRKECNK